MCLNKKNLFLVSSLALIILFLLNISNAKSSDIKIVDGDTIHIDGKKIRFSGIDTPELKQTCLANKEIFFCGLEAKNLLAKIINNRDVNCISEGKDQYKRTLAECFVGDLSLSRYLVREGYAFAYRKYSNKFVKDEEFAKENNKGMWSMSFEYPWEYRKKINLFLIFFLVFLPNKKPSKLKLNILKSKKYIFLTVYMCLLLIH